MTITDSGPEAADLIVIENDKASKKANKGTRVCWYVITGNQRGSPSFDQVLVKVFKQEGEAWTAAVASSNALRCLLRGTS